MNLVSINRHFNLLEGICPQAVELLQDHQFTPEVTRVLRNMKAARQVEAVELMIASNSITVAHADALLKATPTEQRSDVPPPTQSKAPPIEQIVKLEKEMSQVHTQYKDGLFNRAMLTTDGYDHYVAAEGYDALGLPRLTTAPLSEVAPLVADPEMEAALASVGAQWAQEAASEPAAVSQDDSATGCDHRIAGTIARAPENDATTGQPLPESAPPEQPQTKPIRTRENSKQAAIIEMLKRNEGATIDQICECTGWQRHTVRGCFAGAIRKKLGLDITSDKSEGQQRVYRIAA